MSGRAIDPTLRLLANPELLQKRIDQLDAAEQKAQAVIDRVGPIEDLQRTQAEAEKAKGAAATALSEALEKSEAIVEEAKTQAQLIVEKANQEAGRTVSDANSVAAAAESKHSQAANEVAVIQRDREALSAREQELNDVESNLHQKADELAGREQELAGEKSKLAAARDAINAVL